MITEITKSRIRFHYPWASLTDVDSSFVIPAENTVGTTNARQLCYAANKSAARNNSTNRYKASKQPDGSVLVKRIA